MSQETSLAELVQDLVEEALSDQRPSSLFIKARNLVDARIIELEAKAALVDDMNEYIRTFAEAWIEWHEDANMIPSPPLIEAAWALCDCAGLAPAEELTE